MAHDYSDVNGEHVMGASENIAGALRTALVDEHTATQLTDTVLEIVDELNRNELAATLASFVVAHYHLDPEGHRQ